MFTKAVSIAAVVLTSIAPAAAIPLDREPDHPLDGQHSHLPAGMPIASDAPALVVRDSEHSHYPLGIPISSGSVPTLIARDSQHSHHPVGIPISSGNVPTLTARIGGISPSGKPQVHDSHHDDHVPSGIPSMAGMPLYTPTVSNPLKWPLGIPVTESIKPRDAAWTAHPTVAVPPQQALVTEVPLFTVAKGNSPDNVWVPPTVKGIRTTVFGEGMVKRDLPTLVATPTLKTVYTPVQIHAYTPVQINTPTPTHKPWLGPGQDKSKISELFKFISGMLHKFLQSKEKEHHATTSGQSHTSGQVQLPDKTYHDFEDTAYHHPEMVHGGAKHEASHVANHRPSQVIGGAKHEASHVAYHHPDPVHGNLQHEASHLANHHPDPVHGNLQHEASHIANHHPDPVHGNLQHEASHVANHHPDPLHGIAHGSGSGSSRGSAHGIAHGDLQHGAIPTPKPQTPNLVLTAAQLRKLSAEERRIYAEFHSKLRNAKEREIFERFLREKLLNGGFAGEGALDVKVKDSHQFHPGHVDVPEVGRSSMPVKAEKRATEHTPEQRENLEDWEREHRTLQDSHRNHDHAMVEPPKKVSNNKQLAQATTYTGLYMYPPFGLQTGLPTASRAPAPTPTGPKCRWCDEGQNSELTWNGSELPCCFIAHPLDYFGSHPDHPDTPFHIST